MRIEDAEKCRRVPVVYRAPFDFGAAAFVDQRPHGESIFQIVLSVPNLPRTFLTRGVVCINGEAVPRDRWALVRPKPSSDNLPIAVTLHWAPTGGGSGGSGTGKAIVGLVAALALIVVTGGIAGGALSVAGGIGGIFPFAAGSLSAQLLAGAIGIAGALAITALTRPPTAAADNTAAASSTNSDQPEAAAATGNILSKGGAIPRIVGTRKVFPPLASEPVVELVNADEFVEALFVLNGPHQLNDIRVAGTSIVGATDISVETREGWESDGILTSIVRQGRTIQPQLTLSAHQVSPAAQTLLLHPTDPTQDVPLWHGVISRTAPDEIWLHLALPQGLSQSAAATATNIPFRIRIRKLGDSAWINLPEFHVSDGTISQLRKAVLIKWKPSEPLVPVPASAGFTYANVAVPVQTVAPATQAQWLAHSYFSDVAGNAYLSSGGEATTKIKNMNMMANRVEFYLDAHVFPHGIYEINIMRGMAYNAASFVGSTYTFGGVVWDLFNYQSITSPAIVMTRANLTDTVSLIRVISIWNDYPVKAQGFALIAMKARNRSIQSVSTVASGYVKDWDGVGWNTWTTTSNPAPHYTDILSGAQNIDPLPPDLRDDAGLVAWRGYCNANGWTCDAIVDDTRTQDALSLLASCGYAKPYQSDTYGVAVDRDRSADAPEQVFSRRNAANVRFERAYPRVPDGFLITYRDNSIDDDQAQTTVYQRDRSISDTSLLESVTYDGLVDIDSVQTRGQFDLDQANLRATFYYLDADIEALVCRCGSLVALEHDILSKRAGDGYVKSKTLSGATLTGLVLDSEIPITNVADMHSTADMHAVPDMHDVGVSTGIVIRRNDGTLSTHTLSNGSGSSNTLTLATPIADTSAIQGYADTNSKYGCLVVAGELTTIYRRLLVAGIKATADLKATLTLVDEAPGLVRT